MEFSPKDVPNLRGETIFGTSQYYLRRCLGEGAFGTVYLSEQRIMKQPVREVAIKITKAANITDSQIRKIFGEAIKIMKLLQESKPVKGRQHLVSIHNMGVLEQHEGRGYIVMEYVRGKSLRQVINNFRSSSIDRPRMPKNVAVEYARQICTGVAVAHNMNPRIVHCDLKPENILLERSSELIKVVDFGVASQVNELIEQAEVMGNIPQYSAAEVFYGRSNCASDIFSIGLMLYEMLTGINPFAEVGRTEELSGALLCNAHIKSRQFTQIEPPSKYNLECRVAGDHLDDLVLKCLSFNDDDRYSSAMDLLTELEHYQAGYRLEGPFPVKTGSYATPPVAGTRQQRLDRARALFDAKNYIGAITELSRVGVEYQGEPDKLTVEIKTLLGDAQLEMGNYNSAAQSYADAIYLDTKLRALGKGSRRELFYKAANVNKELGNDELAESYEKLAH